MAGTSSTKDNQVLSPTPHQSAQTHTSAGVGWCPAPHPRKVTFSAIPSSPTSPLQHPPKAQSAPTRHRIQAHTGHKPHQRTKNSQSPQDTGRTYIAKTSTHAGPKTTSTQAQNPGLTEIISRTPIAKYILHARNNPALMQATNQTSRSHKSGRTSPHKENAAALHRNRRGVSSQSPGRFTATAAALRTNRHGVSSQSPRHPKPTAPANYLSNPTTHPTLPSEFLFTLPLHHPTLPGELRRWLPYIYRELRRIPP